MPPRSKKTTEYCEPANNILCPEIIELRVIVKNIGDSVLAMHHLIMGNGTDGQRVNIVLWDTMTKP